MSDQDNVVQLRAVPEGVLSNLIGSSCDPCSLREYISNHPLDNALAIINELDSLTAMYVLLAFSDKAIKGDLYSRELVTRAAALDVRGSNCLESVLEELDNEKRKKDK